MRRRRLAVARSPCSLRPYLRHEHHERQTTLLLHCKPNHRIINRQGDCVIALASLSPS